MGSSVASYRPTQVSPGRTRQAPRTLPQPSWLLLIVITATVAGLVWGLMQQRRPQIDPRQVIAINLAAGELAFKHQRYVEPAGHSAAHYFNAVLALDPDQPRALRGLHQISEQFAERAKLAILDSRFADAAVAIEQLRRLKPDDRRLGLIEIELRRALDTHVATLTAIAANAESTSIEAPTQNAAVDENKSIDAIRTVDKGISARSVAAPSRPLTMDSARSTSSTAGTRDAQLTANTLAARGAEVSSSSVSTNETGTDPVDELAEQQLAAALLAQTEAARDDDAQPDVSHQGNDFTQSSLEASVDQPLPAPAAQLAATTSSPMPIEVSARWLPTAIELVEPHYPQAAQVRGIEGWVDLMITVAPTGEVIDAHVRDREGSRSFERAALLAVRQWRYEPNAAGSSAPAIEIPVRVAFKLE